MRKNIILIIFFICSLASAQPPSKFYTKFGGGGVDIGYGVKQTFKKGYIVTGSTTSFGSGASDVYLVKIDSMGWTTWSRTFGGFGNDVGRSVLQLSDTGYVIAGFTNSFGNGGYDAYILRTDKNGILLWQKTFGGLDWDFAYDLVQSSDGNLMICGSTTSFGAGGKDGLLLKYDLNGTLIWSKYFGGAEDDELNSIINTNDNVLATIGGTKSFGEINGDFYFVKADLNGDTLFTKHFGGPGKDYGTDLIQKYYGLYIIAGAKTYSNNPHTQSVSMKCSPTMQVLEEANFYASDSDERWVAISDTYAGNDQTAFLRNVPVPSFKIQGNIFVANDGAIWPDIVNSFGGSENEEMFAMDRTLDGGYVSVGTTKSYFSVNGDVFLMKQDSTITSYQSIVSVNEAENLKPVLQNLGDHKFKLNFEKTQTKKIKIFNLQGSEILNQTTNEATVDLDLEAFASGVYILIAESNAEKTVLKLINQ